MIQDTFSLVADGPFGRSRAFHTRIDTATNCISSRARHHHRPDAIRRNHSRELFGKCEGSKRIQHDLQQISSVIFVMSTDGASTRSPRLRPSCTKHGATAIQLIFLVGNYQGSVAGRSHVRLRLLSNSQTNSWMTSFGRSARGA